MKWTYYTSASWKEDGKEHTIITQLYQIGIYAIIDGDSALQTTLTPSSAEKLFKKFIKYNKTNVISNLSLGRKIVVIEDEDGFYKEVINEE